MSSLTVLVLVFVLSSAYCQDCIFQDANGANIPWDGTEYILASFQKTFTGEVGSFSYSGTTYIDSGKKTPCNKLSLEVVNNPTSGQVVFKSNVTSQEWDGVLTANQKTCELVLQFDRTNCTGAAAQRSISFTIEDVNLAEPQFSSVSYDFTVPFPLGQGIKLDSILGQTISATDTDFSSMLSFTLDDPDGNFELTTQGSGNSKTFIAHLQTKKLVSLTSPVELTATVTDNAPDGSKSNTASIKIQPDLAHSPPKAPEFDETVVSSTDGAEVTIKLTGAYTGTISATVDKSGEFSAKVDAAAQLVTVSLNSGQNLTASTVVLVTVTYTNSASGLSSSATAVAYFECSTCAISSTSSSSTSSSSTSSSSTSSSSTSSSSTSSSSTSSSSTSSSSTDGTDTEPPDGGTSTSTTTESPDDDDEEDIGLLVSTIILAILCAGLAGVIYYMYRKRKSSKKSSFTRNIKAGSKTTSSDLNKSSTPTVVIESEKSLTEAEGTKEVVEGKSDTDIILNFNNGKDMIDNNKTEGQIAEHEAEKKQSSVEDNQLSSAHIDNEAGKNENDQKEEKSDAEIIFSLNDGKGKIGATKTEDEVATKEFEDKQRLVKSNQTSTKENENEEIKIKADKNVDHLQTGEERTRKRSITFSEDDAKAREYRENEKIQEVDSSSNENETSRNGSTVSEEQPETKVEPHNVTIF